MRAAGVVAGVVALALVAGAVFAVSQIDFFGLGDTDDEFCEAEVNGDVARLGLDQAENASLIAAIGVRRDLPARAVSIALATAFQESKILNLDYGDRDSLGLFQQRPSQGWGTPEQIRDPEYATETFFDALVEVDGYEDMPIHDAAQAVQRSADGSAYAVHEVPARVLASALTGWSPAAFACEVEEPDDSGQRAGADGLTPNARDVVDDVAEVFGGVGGSATRDGQTVTFDAPESRRHGWVLAQYLVGNAERLEIRSVAYERKLWTAAASDEGWQRSDDRLDRVRVDVA
ncbi:MAG TPA: hypothetical protein VEX15_02140 [Nocardioidaceae bacterium]|nr:hypothetical protein [Nocardioidaceae bacterium]